MSEWQPIMFAPRDGSAFEGRTRRGMIFSCRYNLQRTSFINTATNHRVNPHAWRPLSSTEPKGDSNV